MGAQLDQVAAQLNQQMHMASEQPPMGYFHQMEAQMSQEAHMASQHLAAAGPIQWPLLTPPASMPYLMPMGGPMGGPAMATPSLMLPPMGLQPPMQHSMGMHPPMQVIGMPPPTHAMGLPPPAPTTGFPSPMHPMPPMDQPTGYPPVGQPVNPSARMVLPDERIIKVGNMRMAKGGESVLFMAKNPANKVQVYDDQSMMSVRDQAFTMGFSKESVLDVTGPATGPKQVTCTAALAEAFFEQGGISFWQAGAEPYDCDVLELCAPDGTEYPSLERTQAVAARSEQMAMRREERKACTARLFVDMPRNFSSLNDVLRDQCKEVAKSSVRSLFQGSDCKLVFSTAETAAGHSKASILTQVTAPEGADIIAILKEVGLPAIKYIPTPQKLPASTRLDSATAAKLGVKNCCLSTSCSGPPCDARRSWEKSNAPNPRESSLKRYREEKQQSQDQAFATVAAQVAAARKDTTCRKWRLGRCAVAGGHDGSTHGTPEQAKAIKCCAARKPGEPGYHRHYGTVCSFTPETCPYAEHPASN